MQRHVYLLSLVTTLLAFPGMAGVVPPAELGVDPLTSTALKVVHLPPKTACVFHQSRVFQLPDPNCTPGAVNRTITIKALKNPNFHLWHFRETFNTPTAQVQVYTWYKLLPPEHNFGSNQTCELDHLVPLSLGGSNALENIWPQCDRPSVPFNNRAFKQKDIVENYLSSQVQSGAMGLRDAQVGIASDWAQYLPAAIAWNRGRRSPP